MKRGKIRLLIRLAVVSTALSLLLHAALSTRSASSGNLITYDQTVESTINRVEQVKNSTGAVSLPELIECVNQPDAKNIRRVGTSHITSRAGGAEHELTYHLFRYEKEGEYGEEYGESIVLEFNTACFLSYHNNMGMEISEAVPMPVAQSLSLQWYEDVAKSLGGVEELRREVLLSMEPALDGTLPGFTPEKLWALEQLDIILAEDSYRVIEIEPYEPGQFSRFRHQ